MVIVQLTGGLGNQLFQCAAGKSLALANRTSLKFDVDFFHRQDARHLDLKYFIFDLDVASDTEVSRLQPRGVLEKMFQRTLPAYKRKSYREPYFHFDRNFFNAGQDVYLKGNWQSEKYFSRFDDQIRKDLIVKEEFVTDVKKMAEKFRMQSSVAVHVRRGDYLHPKTLEYHGILPKDYYNKAIEAMADKVSQPIFYFFSDDINWVQQNINLNYPHRFISGIETKSAIEDFYLMQSCQNNIIANSSFSWWAGWLNGNANKLVIAPKKWFNKGPEDTYDLIPKGWLEL